MTKHPTSPALQRAVTLHNQGQLHQARLIYERILRSAPRNADALHLLGVLFAQSGRPGEAVQWISRALDVAPHNSTAHKNCGLAQAELGQHEAAFTSYDRAAALDMRDAEPHFLRGNLLKDAKRWGEALVFYEQAIRLNPNHAGALGNKGICLAEAGDLDLAMATYDASIRVDPLRAEPHGNRGLLFCRLRRWQDAVASFTRATELKPRWAEAFANRAFALLELDLKLEALASCDRAVELDANLVHGHVNRGGVLMSMDRADQAVVSYDRALRIDPDNASAHLNRAMARLATGDFAGGWQDYEWRWKDRSNWIAQEHRGFSQPLWLGETQLIGRTILLHAEQGYGDTLQFCRYVKLVVQRGARVILEVPGELVELLKCLEGVSQVIARGDALPPFDTYCPLLSLPLALGTRLDSVPAEIPYLRSSQSQRGRWSALLGPAVLPRVGLVWSGGFRPGRPELWSMNSRRNLPMENLSRLDCPNIEFYSLQKGDLAEAELAAFAVRPGRKPAIRDLTSQIRDFSDTAGLIEQLDLVIGVDTATVHLAGALGKPVWILNRFAGCWRWLRGRSDSPWYPTARLYRQERAGEWTDVLDRVNADLLSRFPG